jgi:hypothetical protein
MEGDLRLYMMLSQHGKCRFLPEFTAVYRVHPSSMMSKWRSSYQQQKARIINRFEAAEKWNQYLGGGYDKEVETLRRGLSLALVSAAVRNLDWNTAIKYSPHVDPNRLSGRAKVLSLFLLKAMHGVWTRLGLITSNRDQGEVKAQS